MNEHRPTVMVINLDHIRHNVRQFRHLAPQAAFMAVVKADGYGHGAVQIAKAARQAGASCFGVSAVCEGVVLREAGIQEPILALSGILPEETILCHQHAIDATVSGLDFLPGLEKLSSSFTSPLRIHVKIDTGMHRLGILPDELPDFTAQYAAAQNLLLTGAATHFPCAAEDEAFSHNQINRFNECVRQLEASLGEIPYRHAANSAAAIRFPEARFNLIRVGLGLYGYHDDESLQEQLFLKPAMTLRTRITSLRTLSEGERIGYGRTFQLNRKSLIATIPIGYADGYPRSLSNKGWVLVNEKPAPIVGRVCMDQCMIDVTEVDNPKIGNEVVLIGRQGTREISLYEISRLAGTIPNEILTGMSLRVRRTYE